MSYGGTTYPTEEVIEVRQGGDTYMVLENFPLKDGEADIPFLYGASGKFTGIGKDVSNALITSNTSTITFDKDSDEAFIASYASGTEGESYLMRATNFLLDGTTNETDIQYYKNGVWTDAKKGASDGDTFSMGNAELGVGAIHRTDKTVVITANTSTTNFYHLYSKEGLRTYLPFTVAGSNASAINVSNPGYINFTGGAGTVLGHNGTAFSLVFNEEDKDGNIGAGPGFNVSVGWDSSSPAEPEVSDLVNESYAGGLEIEETDVWRSFMYSALATEFLWDKPSSGQDSIKIIYHGGEVESSVYVTEAGASISGEAGVMTVSDANVASVAGKNLVVVGGSAINSVAAELLGGALSEGAFTDATGVAAGEFLIQSFTRSGKTALLVAGYTAADTEKAVTYLLNNDVDTTVGKKYKGTSGTEASLVVV